MARPNPNQDMQPPGHARIRGRQTHLAAICCPKVELNSDMAGEGMPPFASVVTTKASGRSLK